MRTRLPIFALLVLAAAALGWTAANRASNHAAATADAIADASNNQARAADSDAQEPPQQPPRPSPPPSPPESAAGDLVIPDSDALLRRAVAQLNAAGSIEAKVRQRVDLFDRELIGSGSYAQLGSGIATRLRLEMRMRTDKAATELLQVCNGETLWTFNAADGLRTLRRVDLDRVIDALRGDRDGQAAGGYRGGSIGLGGLPWMLEGLRQFCEFAPAQSGRLGELDVLVLSGTWRSEKLLALVDEAERKRIAAGGKFDLARLPPHLPDSVVIYLGRDDLFPYRFDYRRTALPQESPAAAAKTIVSLEFYEVLAGGAIAAERFTYKPGQGAIDDTERYIERLTADVNRKPSP